MSDRVQFLAAEAGPVFGTDPFWLVVVKALGVFVYLMRGSRDRPRQDSGQPAEEEQQPQRIDHSGTADDIGRRPDERCTVCGEKHAVEAQIRLHGGVDLAATDVGGLTEQQVRHRDTEHRSTEHSKPHLKYAHRHPPCLTTVE